MGEKKRQAECSLFDKFIVEVIPVEICGAKDCLIMIQSKYHINAWKAYEGI